MTTASHTLRVPDGSLYYEVRGSGPVLVILGAPMSSPFFAPLADTLSDEYTVVTTDPRGISRSVLDDPEQDSTPVLRAGDVVAILDDLGAPDADVFGSSGGAVTGLALVAGYPDRVRTLVAHEPPVTELLPDAAEQRAGTDDIVATFHRDGLGAAFAKFMASAGFTAEEAESAPVPQEEPAARGEPSAQELADGERFLVHEMQGTTRYVPDVAALRAAPTRIVIGLGVDSGGLVTYRTSKAIAERLGIETTEFPGDHGGFLGATPEFAEVLRKVLAG
jgi:pimeloyl-ACP methyl ester carboxylesterase